MANQLAMDKVQAIKSLHATGMSERQIARTLAISRKAVRRHLGRGQPKDTKAPTGEAPTGSPASKDTKAPTGSGATKLSDHATSRSLCITHRDTILTKLEQGLTAQRIYQDLCTESGFTGKYSSVRRFVRQFTNQSEPAFQLLRQEETSRRQIFPDEKPRSMGTRRTPFRNSSRLHASPRTRRQKRAFRGHAKST